MFHIWKIYLDVWGHDYNKLVWTTFGYTSNDPIAMKFKLDMLTVYTNVVSLELISQSMLKWGPERGGGRQTLPRHDTTVSQMGV